MNNQKTTGDFKISEKFIEFVGAKGNINFISNEAHIEGKLLSGLDFNDRTFKLTIYQDGTVDFDDVEGQSTSEEQRFNLLKVITEKTIVPFRKRMVVRELNFTSVNEVNGKKINLYLSVEHQKPIDKLASIFDENLEITDTQQEKLDALMSLFDEEIESNTEPELIEQKEKNIEEKSSDIVFDVNKNIEESFVKMKQEKIEVLKKELEQRKSDLIKFERDKNFAQSKIEESKSDIKLIESRIESLRPKLENNGWYFNVSERLNEKISLDKEIYELIKAKVSKIKGINSENFMKLFEDGEFKVRFAKFENNEFLELKDDKELPEELTLAFSELKIFLKEDVFYYIGELDWADIVNKLIKLGFSQSSDWDKLCDSNSFKITEEIL